MSTPAIRIVCWGLISSDPSTARPEEKQIRLFRRRMISIETTSTPPYPDRPMSQLPKVVVTDFIDEPLDHERRILDGHATITALNAMREDELIGQIEDAEAIMVYHYFRFSRKSIERLERCKIIVRPGVGYDGIDLDAARERGIPVCNVPDYGTEEVADSALAMALSLSRGSHFLNSRLRRGIGEWNVDQGKP